MKQRVLSLILALALCLGLTVPALAADASGLDANGAKAFYDVLTAAADKAKKEDNGLIGYADLKDFNKDGIPELVVVPVYQGGGTLEIWQLQKGKAVKAASLFCEVVTGAKMSYCTKDGKTFIHYDHYTWHERLNYGEDVYITIGGVYETFSYGSNPDGPNGADFYYFHTMSDGKSAAITKAQFEQRKNAYAASGEPFLTGGGMSWEWDGCFDGKNAVSYQTVLDLLTRKMTAVTPSAAGTFGAYSMNGYIWGDPVAISFNAAKVEKKTVQFRSKWVVGSQEAIEPYRNLNVTMVTLRSDCNISVSIPPDIEASGIQSNLIDDGNGKYTYIPAANTLPTSYIPGTTILNGDDFNMSFLSSTGEDMKKELQAGPLMISIDEDGETYIVAYEKTSSTGFSDVKAGAYYEDAVKWAVDKKITSGTTATTFSPNNTCTVSQILTFLYRANGRPNQGSDERADAVLWAQSKGIAAGNPDAPCTRAMAVTCLWKLAGSPAASGARFTDVSAGASYAKAVAWAVTKGVTSGATATTFNPNGTCTRGQIVTFLYRAMK